MGVLDIIALLVFPFGLTSFQLVVEQEKTPMEWKIALFRSEVVSTVVITVGFLMMAASGVVLFLYSWMLLLGVFLGTAFTYRVFGRVTVIWFWALFFRGFTRN